MDTDTRCRPPHLPIAQMHHLYLSTTVGTGDPPPMRLLPHPVPFRVWRRSQLSGFSFCNILAHMGSKEHYTCFNRRVFGTPFFTRRHDRSTRWPISTARGARTPNNTAQYRARAAKRACEKMRFPSSTLQQRRRVSEGRRCRSSAFVWLRMQRRRRRVAVRSSVAVAAVAAVAAAVRRARWRARWRRRWRRRCLQAINRASGVVARG